MTLSKLIFICTLLAGCLGYPVFGQELRYGVKAGYVTNHRLFSSTSVEGTRICGSQRTGNGMDGWRMAGLARLEKNRWFAQAELAYAFNIGGSGPIISINNWNNPANITPDQDWISSEMPLLRQLEVCLNGGYRPLKWLRLSAGVGVWFQTVKEPQKLRLIDETLPGRDNGYVRAQNEMIRFAYGIQESFLPFLLTRYLGVGVDIRRFSLHIGYDRSLTPVSRYLEYKDQLYVFIQRADRIVVSVGFRSKPKPFGALRKAGAGNKT